MIKIRVIKIIALLLIFSIPKIKITNSSFVDKEISGENILVAGCWLGPSKPNLSYPENNYLAYTGSSWLSNPYMDWADSWVCPEKEVSYQYESYHDSALTNLAYRSGMLVESKISALETPNGIYYWRVRAYDGEQWSQWSDVWLLVVDRDGEILSLHSSAGLLDFYQNTSSFDVSYSGSVNYGVVSEIQLYYSYNGGAWVYFDSVYPGVSDPAGSFSFTSPQGDGYYEFLTIAVSEYGAVEDDSDASGAIDPFELALLFADSSTTVDTKKPLTMLSLQNPLAVANDQIYNGGFENGDLDGWTIESTGSDHQATGDESKSGAYSALVGFRDSDPLAAGAYDLIKQSINLASSPVSTLSFWYRLLTDDLASGGFFDASVVWSGGSQTVAHDGWDDPLVLDTDLGWKNITYQLNGLEGEAVDIEFRVTQPDDLFKTWVYLDDIRVCSAENKLEAVDLLSLSTNDSDGSDNSTIYYSVDGGSQEVYSGEFSLPEGEHELSYYSQDEAGNVEDEKSIDITVVPEAVDYGIVLNEIMPDPVGSDQGSNSKPLDGEWVVLWNNSGIDVSVNQWYLYDADGHGLEITSSNGDNDSDNNNGGEHIVPSGAWLKVYRNGDSDFSLNNDGDTVYLYDARKDLGGVLIDSFTYGQSTEGKSFKRSPDGVGVWMDPYGEPVLETKVFGGKMSFEVFGIGDYERLDYEIIYDSSSGQEAVLGSVELSGEDKFSKEGIVMGTCSSNTCVLDKGVKEVNFKIVLFDKDKGRELELLKTSQVAL